MSTLSEHGRIAELEAAVELREIDTQRAESIAAEAEAAAAESRRRIAELEQQRDAVASRFLSVHQQLARLLAELEPEASEIAELLKKRLT